MPSTNPPRAVDPGAYVTRSIERANDGTVTYTVVDMAGRVSNVTIPHRLTLSELVDPIIRAHVEHHASRDRRP